MSFCLLRSLSFCLALSIPSAAQGGAPQRAASESLIRRAFLAASVDGGAVEVDLALERFRVATSDTRFVVGGPDGDRPLEFDHEGLLAYRGSVDGLPGSSVFLAGRAGALRGRLELGAGTADYALRESTDGSGRLVGAPLGPSASLPPGIGLCGVGGPRRPGTLAFGGGGPAESTRVVELAVETDYELFRLFGDLGATGDYVVELYAANSAVYMRDLNARFILTFVRLWDTPVDLFNEPSPLGPFRDYWENNMGGVSRALAQFLSGRRDFPFGGQAYLDALCGSFGYSVVGYIGGVLGDGLEPGIFQYDLLVTAHELGHNFGALHTQNYGLDDCDQPEGDARRGSLMSYCSQTRSGGDANADMRFHTVPQSDMRAHMASVSCLVPDCNGNGVDDGTDIAMGMSLDLNGNQRPDECEDCNINGVLDPLDISSGNSDDDDGNGLPDECQPDCNGNGVVDVLDISMGTSLDAHGNGIPDECEADCDGNLVSDYSQIQLNMSLDINRDAILDSCQDCDNDGTIDLVARNGAHDMWIASHIPQDPPSRYHALTGVRHVTADVGHVQEGNDVAIGPDRNVYVSSSDHRVARFDSDGAFLGDFVAAGAGGLDDPMGLVFGPNGDLYVASRGSDEVLRYSGASGAFLGAFVPSGTSPLNGPTTLSFGPGAHLFVADDTNRIRRYHRLTGAYLGEFVSLAGNGGLLAPRGMAFTPDGRLLVTSHGTDQVLAYDDHTGAFLGQFNDGGTATALSLDAPWGIRMGPDGNVYVSRHDTSGDHLEDRGGMGAQDLHLSAARVYVFDLALGYFLRTYVNGNDTGLEMPTGFAFLPGRTIDCNLNGLPDVCDIANGTSPDDNGNGVPDECDRPPCLELQTAIDDTPPGGTLDVSDFKVRCYPVRLTQPITLVGLDLGSAPHDGFDLPGLIVLDGPGAGTVKLVGLRIGPVSLRPSASGRAPAGISGGGFDVLHLVDSTVLAPRFDEAGGAAGLGEEPKGRAGVSVEVPFLIVEGSFVAGGAPDLGQAGPLGGGIHAPRSVVALIDSEVHAGTAGGGEREDRGLSSVPAVECLELQQSGSILRGGAISARSTGTGGSSDRRGTAIRGDSR